MARRGGIRKTSIRASGTLPISSGSPIQGLNVNQCNFYEEFPAPFTPASSGLARSIGSIAVEVSPGGGLPYYSKWFIKASAANTGWEQLSIGSLGVGAALQASGVPGGSVIWTGATPIVVPFDWRDYYRWVALNRLNLSPFPVNSYASFYSECITNDFVSNGSGGGSANPTPPLNFGSGFYVTQTGGAANGGAFLSPSGQGSTIGNMRTKRWFFAANFTAGGALNPGTQIALGIRSLSNNNVRVGLGFDYAHNSSLAIAGIFNSAIPANTWVPATCANSTINFPTSATSSMWGYIYSNGSNVYASLNGEAEFLVCSSLLLPTDIGQIMPSCINQLNATAQQVYLDSVMLITQV